MNTLIKHTSIAVAALAVAGIFGQANAEAPAGWQFGAKVAKPYTQADIDYGQILSDVMDRAREASRDNTLSRTAMEPFKVVGDLYFVGVHNFGVYVIKTPEGVIMLDTGWAGDVTAKTEESLKKLGIKLTDIKIIVMTENHGDHNQAAAYFHEKSGAKLYVMQGDVEGVEKGTPGNAANPTGTLPTKVDVVLHDRDQIKLGGKVLTAYHIPGHTKGSTSWIWQETENGVTYNVGDMCCWFTPNNVVTDPDFPIALLKKNWEVLKSLSIDVPVPGIHTYHFDMINKLGRLRSGEKNVWVDPQGYRGIIAHFEQEFIKKLEKQLKEGPPPAPVRGQGGPGGPGGAGAPPPGAAAAPPKAP